MDASHRKKAGKITNLYAELAARPMPDSGLGIGQTRWATHGVPTDSNAHPHLSAGGRVALIHNGIIENFAVLRAELEAEGVVFASQTDTEAAAQLLGREVEAGADLADALRAVCRRLEGAFTLVAVARDEPHRLVAARRNSPLVVGVGEGENFVASDVAAFIEFTRFAIELGQDQVVDLTSDSITVTDFAGNPAETHPFEVTWDLSAAEKAGYDWFMRKEIYEQPRAVADTLLGRFNPDGSRSSSTSCTSPKPNCVDRQDHHRGVWYRVLRRMVAKYDRTLDADRLRGGDRQRVPLPRPDHHPVDPWSR